jgi:isopentenyl-diphosphate Delta-isomerase
MGVDCHLEEIFVLRYQIELDSGMTENEYDHVLLGRGDDLSPSPDSEEVSDWKWCDLEDLWADMSNSPEHYTSWFKILAEEMKRRNVA